LPRPAQQPPKGAGWIHEIKHDGFRTIARRNAKDVRTDSPAIASTIFGYRHAAARERMPNRSWPPSAATPWFSAPYFNDD
jgi:hypothetical protein